jgi:hypothetical protein
MENNHQSILYCLLRLEFPLNCAFIAIAMMLAHLQANGYQEPLLV